MHLYLLMRPPKLMVLWILTQVFDFVVTPTYKLFVKKTQILCKSYATNIKKSNIPNPIIIKKIINFANKQPLRVTPKAKFLLQFEDGGKFLNGCLAILFFLSKKELVMKGVYNRPLIDNCPKNSKELVLTCKLWLPSIKEPIQSINHLTP